MKGIKINDDLYINIDLIYSIQHTVNSEHHDAWVQAVENAVKSDNFKEYVEHNNITKSSAPEEIEKIYNIIKSQIGDCPPVEHTYTIILATGVKITVDENIFNIIRNYIESKLDEN